MNDPYDSWDMENVQYIRTKSRCNSTEMERLSSGGRRLLTHEKTLGRRNRRSLSCLYISKNSEQVVGAFSSGSSCGSLNTEVSSTDARKEEGGILMRIRTSNESISSGEEACGSCKLDDCYVLDVVTVRNESVVVEGKKKRPPAPSKIPVLMRKAKSVTTLPATNTAPCSKESNPKVNLNKQNGIKSETNIQEKKFRGSNNYNRNVPSRPNKPQPNNNKTLQQYSRRTGHKETKAVSEFSDSKKESLPEIVGKPIGNKDSAKSQSFSQLQWAGSKQGTDKTAIPFIPNRSSLLLKLANDDYERSSVRTSSSGLSELDVALSTSNSSRSDGLYGGEFDIYSEGSSDQTSALGAQGSKYRSAPEGRHRPISSQSSNHYGQIIDEWPRMGNWTPTNFGVNKQGQLVIDYSQNWKGLEAYVKKIQF